MTSAPFIERKTLRAYPPASMIFRHAPSHSHRSVSGTVVSKAWRMFRM
jgi:hypothetical protein